MKFKRPPLNPKKSIKQNNNKQHCPITINDNLNTHQESNNILCNPTTNTPENTYTNPSPPNTDNTDLNPQELDFINRIITCPDDPLKTLQDSGIPITDPFAAIRKSREILDKFVRGVETRRLLRLLGASEVRIIQLVLQIAEDPANTPKTRLAALELLAKMHGMTREMVGGAQAAEIIIEATTGGPGLSGLGPEDEVALGGSSSGRTDEAGQVTVKARAQMRTLIR